MIRLDTIETMGTTCTRRMHQTHGTEAMSQQHELEAMSQQHELEAISQEDVNKNICTMSGKYYDTYIYQNDYVSSHSVLYTCEGEIKFKSFGFTTPWHGFYRRNGGALEVTFHHRGNVEKMKRTILLETAERSGVFNGFDYCTRPITMILIHRHQWCWTCGRWHERKLCRSSGTGQLP